MAVTGNEPVSVADLKLACDSLIARIAALEAARTPTEVWSGTGETASFTEGEPGDIIVAEIYETPESGGGAGQLVKSSTVLNVTHGVSYGPSGLQITRSGGVWKILVGFGNWSLRNINLIRTQN